MPGPVQCALRRSPPLAVLAVPRPLVLGVAAAACPSQQPPLQRLPGVLQHGGVEECLNAASAAVATAAPAATATTTAATCTGQAQVLVSINGSAACRHQAWPQTHT